MGRGRSIALPAKAGRRSAHAQMRMSTAGSGRAQASRYDDVKHKRAESPALLDDDAAMIQLFPATGNGDVAETAGFDPLRSPPDEMRAPRSG